MISSDTEKMLGHLVLTAFSVTVKQKPNLLLRYHSTSIYVHFIGSNTIPNTSEACNISNFIRKIRIKDR